jgi:hypothetical protein
MPYFRPGVASKILPKFYSPRLFRVVHLPTSIKWDAAFPVYRQTDLHERHPRIEAMSCITGNTYNLIEVSGTPLVSTRL